MSTLERNSYNEAVHLPNTTNLARISGIVSGEAVYNHEVFGEAFFTIFVDVKRQSGVVDHIPVTVSERLLPGTDVKGKYVYIEGQVRTYSKIGTDGRGHLYVRMFAKKIYATFEHATDENYVALTGIICKPPVHRVTPFGREISDILLAVNREFGKSDYIPCITWGRTALYTASMTVGSSVRITGRFQSRKYKNTYGEEHEVYEISVHRLEVPADAE